jgi:hypothetical protein
MRSWNGCGLASKRLSNNFLSSKRHRLKQGALRMSERRRE